MGVDKFVIIGQTGEYSDNFQWLVGYTDSEEKAKNFVLLCDEHAKALFVEKRNLKYPSPEYTAFHKRLHSWYSNGTFKSLHPLDPKFRMDYTGTIYHYEKVNSIDE